MRRPSPALIVATLALFVALSGAGFAATLALSPVSAPRPLMMVPGKVSASGKVTGARLTGGRVSAGVYTITISGNTFATSKTFAPGQTTVSPLVLEDSAGTPRIPPACDVAKENIAQNGSAKLEVDCFTYGAGGWQPTDAAFDFQVVGPRPS